MKFIVAILSFLSIIGAGNAGELESDSRSSSLLDIHSMKPNPKPYKITYDDGTESPWIQVKMRGDVDSSTKPLIYEETLEGFTVGLSSRQRQRGKKYYTYRDVNMKTGELIETGLIVGKDDPNSSNIQKDAATKSEKLKKSMRSKRDLEEGNARKLRVAGQAPLLAVEEQQDEDIVRRRTAITSGILKNLVIPIRFSDHTSRTLPSQSDLNILMNNEGPASQCPTGSVRDVYLQSSFNKLNIQSTVVDWVDIDFSEAYCANGQSGLSSRIHECLTNALDKVAASGVDFGDFDMDNSGVIDGITFFHSGYAAEFGGIDSSGTDRNGRIWSHKWSIWSTNWSSNGVRVYEYHINPSLWSTSGNAIGRIGVVAHETGHFLGLPDLYDYGDATYGDGEGIGSWGLMANSWGFDGSQYYPPHMSAWGKYTLGWVNPTVVSSSGTYSLGQACENDDMILISEGYPNGEYLLIENRQPCGFETQMGQGGLAIFHIDSNANNIRGYPQQTGWPTNGNHYEVALLQADGTYGLERGFNRGDSGDMFHASGVTSIGPNGTSAGAAYPNTKAYNGGNIIDTGVTISNIGAASATMTFDITIGEPVPTASPTTAPTPVRCGAGQMEVIISVTTDSYPQENSWTLTSSNGESRSSPAFTTPATEYANSFCLDPSLCHTFTLVDTYGDGIFTSNGDYSLTVDGTVLMSNNGAQFSELTEKFGSCNSPPAPTASPSASPSISPSVSPTLTAPTPTAPSPTATPPTSFTTCNDSNKDRLTLYLKTDNYGFETTVKVFKRRSNGLFTRKVFEKGPFLSNRDNTFSPCLVKTGCYKIVVYDSYGDGMCCNYGNGEFQGYLNGQPIPNVDDVFDSGSISESETFGNC